MAAIFCLGLNVLNLFQLPRKIPLDNEIHSKEGKELHSIVYTFGNLGPVSI